MNLLCEWRGGVVSEQKTSDDIDKCNGQNTSESPLLGLWLCSGYFVKMLEFQCFGFEGSRWDKMGPVKVRPLLICSCITFAVSLSDCNCISWFSI